MNRIESHICSIEQNVYPLVYIYMNEVHFYSQDRLS